VRVQRGRLLLGSSGRAPAAAVLAVCVVVVVVLGLLFRGQTRADGFDNAVDSPFITFFAGHKQLLLWLTLPGALIPAIVVSVAIAGWCLLTGRLNGAVLALTAVPVAGGLDDGLLKHVFNRTYLGSLAFPSGHTSSTVALTATLAVLLLVPPQRASTRAARAALLVVACAIVAVLVVAVMALKWHYFTDTVAGAAVGIGSVCALALILDLAWSRMGVRGAARSAVPSGAGYPHGHMP
jgi:membrane-associated phospholipid phosphatase